MLHDQFRSTYPEDVSKELNTSISGRNCPIRSEVAKADFKRLEQIEPMVESG